MPVGVRVVGLLAAILFAAYALRKYRGRKWEPGDLLIALAIAVGVAAVSVFPQVGGLVAPLLRLNSRLLGVLVVSNLLLFGLFLFVLNQSRAANRRVTDAIRSIAVRGYLREYGKPADRAAAVDKDYAGRIMVVIPAYNEAESLPHVLSAMPQEMLGYGVETLVVVDGGSDDSAEIARRFDRVRVVEHTMNCGQGAALRTGFQLARYEGVDIVVNLDADGQHQPREVEDLVRAIVEGKADLVWGSRFMGYYQDRGHIRHVGVVLFSMLVSVLARHRVTDCVNGFRALRASFLSRLDLREDKFNATELILEAAKKGLRLHEVPVSVLRRFEGESKKPKRLGYPLGVLRVILVTWLR